MTAGPTAKSGRNRLAPPEEPVLPTSRYGSSRLREWLASTNVRERRRVVRAPWSAVATGAGRADPSVSGGTFSEFLGRPAVYVDVPC